MRGEKVNDPVWKNYLLRSSSGKALTMIQTSGLKILKDAHLVVPNAPRKTFYSIRIEECRGTFRVLKVSGALGKVWDKRTWEFSTLDEAERLFNRRIKEKTDPRRRSPRKYSIEYLLPVHTHDRAE